MSKLLAKKKHKHLSIDDLSDAAQNFYTNRTRKHLARCGLCGNRVRDMRTGATAVDHMLRATVEAERLRQQVDRPRARWSPAPSLLSGAEWDQLKRGPVASICLSLITVLMIGLSLPSPDQRYLFLSCLLVYACIIMVIGFVKAINDELAGRNQY